MLRNLVMTVFALTFLSHAEETRRHIIECEPSMVYKCTTEKCDKVQVVNIDEKQYFTIDPDTKKMEGKIGNTTVDIEHIISRHGNEKTFIFFGTHADSKFDWILRIDKKSKKMVLLATNETLDSFTVYGTCAWEETK